MPTDDIREGARDDAPERDELVRAAFEALPAQVALLDADGVIVETNRAWQRFGLENDLQGDPDMVGQNYLAVCDAAEDEMGPLAATGIRAVLDGERDVYTLEYPCHSPEQRRWFTMRAIRLDDVPVAHALVMHIDVTERKEAELDVAERNEMLQTVASVLSHDLRNPLNVALVRTEMVSDEANDPDAIREHAAATAASLRRMETIIGDALALARGADVEATESVDLAETARAAWSHVETADASLATPDTTTVEADPGLLEQLLENLFRNAVEHGSTGPASQNQQDAVEHGSTSPDSQARRDAVENGDEDVTVTVAPLKDGFYVADDGPGVPADRREAIFEMGFTTNSDAGGTGMGLAIAERIASAHGWTVTLAEDSDDAGARFQFTGVSITD